MGKAAALLLLVLACVASSAAQHAVHVKLEVAVSLRSWQDDDLVPPFLRQLRCDNLRDAYHQRHRDRETETDKAE